MTTLDSRDERQTGPEKTSTLDSDLAPEAAADDSDSLVTIEGVNEGIEDMEGDETDAPTARP